MIEKAEVDRALLTAGAIVGALGVALAARGRHSGEADVAIAASMLLAHAPVLLFAGLLGGNRLARSAGWVLLVALALFAGDLVSHDELGHVLFPLAAPMGGSGLILGWLLLAASAWIGWRRR